MRDYEGDLVKILAQEISDEIDNEIINSLRREAGNGIDWFFNDIDWDEI